MLLAVVGAEPSHATAVWAPVGQDRGAILCSGAGGDRRDLFSGHEHAGDGKLSKVPNEKEDGLRFCVPGSGKTSPLVSRWKLRAVKTRLAIALGGGKGYFFGLRWSP